MHDYVLCFAALVCNTHREEMLLLIRGIKQRSDFWRPRFRAITKRWTGGLWASSSMKWQLVILLSSQISLFRFMKRLCLGR